MDGDEKKPRRGLKEISHLFLSGVEQETRPTVHSPLIAFIDPDKECSGELNLAFAERLSDSFPSITLYEFHALQGLFSLQASSTPGVLLKVLKTSNGFGKEVLAEGRASLCLIDLPWYSPGLRESIVGGLDALILVLEPSVRSLKSAYRFLKSSVTHRKDMPWILIQDDEEKAGGLNQAASSFKDLVRNCRGAEPVILGNLHGIVERLKVLPPSPAPDLSQSSPSSPHWFERGRLSETELDAFFTLAALP